MFFDNKEYASQEIQLFPIVVKKYRYKNYKILKEFIGRHLVSSKYQKTNNFDGVKTYFQPNDASSEIDSFFDSDEDVIIDFKNFCEKSASDYVDSVLEEQNSDMFCSNSWVNSYYLENSQQCPHHHMNSYVCGNYYLEFDSKIHSDLHFVNPKINNVFNTAPHTSIFSNLKKPDLQSLKTYNQPSNPVQCVEGDLVIWPAWLVHQVPPSKKGRKTISMNFMPKVIRTVNYGFRVEKL